MDFSQYTRGNSSKLKRIRRCHYCGNELENDGSYLYYQGFCSAYCKKKYIDEGTIKQ